MREFVAERWASDTPEYRKLSATKIRSLVKKVGYQFFYRIFAITYRLFNFFQFMF
jgi:hypothetical protein